MTNATSIRRVFSPAPLAAVCGALLACASAGAPRSSPSSAPSVASSPASSASASTATATSAKAAASPSSTPPRPVSSGAALVTSPCVLHAGSFSSRRRKPSGEVHASCNFGAECFTAHGVETPGDGFVAVACEDTACYCEWSTPKMEDPLREPFSLDALPDHDTCKTELLRRCMRGMRRPRE
jgi:hypothetical protein